MHKTDLLAQVSGSFNAISFFGHALGHALFYGRGAGRMPTASAVVSDIIGVALGTTPAQFKQLNVFADQTPRANVLPFDQLESRYYLRLTAKDQPGVLAAGHQSPRRPQDLARVVPPARNRRRRLGPARPDDAPRAGRLRSRRR